jgi:hypothetical protein
MNKNEQFKADAERYEQEQDKEVLYFVCFVIFVVSVVAFWFGAS